MRIKVRNGNNGIAINFLGDFQYATFRAVITANNYFVILVVLVKFKVFNYFRTTVCCKFFTIFIGNSYCEFIFSTLIPRGGFLIVFNLYIAVITPITILNSFNIFRIIPKGKLYFSLIKVVITGAGFIVVNIITANISI